MPNSSKTTKTKNEKTSHKQSPKSLSRNDERTCARLRMMGALMALASVLMALLPMMYSGIYRYISARTGRYVDNLGVTSMIMSGFVSALLYFLFGLHVIRAGEQNTRLIRGVYRFNLAIMIMSIIAGALLFLPWPVPTFKLMMMHMATAKYIERGIIPMFIMIFVDMALIIGLTASISGISYTCLADKKK